MARLSIRAGAGDVAIVQLALTLAICLAWLGEPLETRSVRKQSQAEADNPIFVAPLCTLATRHGCLVMASRAHAVRPGAQAGAHDAISVALASVTASRLTRHVVPLRAHVVRRGSRPRGCDLIFTALAEIFVNGTEHTPQDSKNISRVWLENKAPQRSHIMFFLVPISTANDFRCRLCHSPLQRPVL